MIIGDAPCPECRKVGRDKTGNHLILFDNGNKYCNRCNYKVIKSQIEEEEPLNKYFTMEEVSTLPILPINQRGLHQLTCEHFGVQVALDEETASTIINHAYPYYNSKMQLQRYKIRDVANKKFMLIGEKCEDMLLFGQQNIPNGGGKRLLICCGECDAMAAWQILRKRNSQYPAHVVSPVNGENLDSIKQNAAFIQSYAEIVVAGDMDATGRKFANDVALLFGPAVRIMSFSEKDVNDMLMQGKEQEFIDAYYSAKPYKADYIASVDDVFEDAIKMPEWGLSYPWPSLTALTYGIRRKECIFLGAGVGIGKTDWALQLQEHLINFHGVTPGLLMLEQPVGRTLKTLAGKFAGIPFHKPDANFTQDQLIEGIERLRDKVYLFNHYGVKDWDSAKKAIRTMVVYHGIKDIFIDPITALVSHLSSSEANDEINKIAGELASMTHELDFTAYGFSHLNAPKTGPPHERGGMVHESQFTGSRGLMRYGHYLFGLERNKDPELTEAERNISKFVLLKDREFGNSGSFHIKYNKNTGTYLE
jgi:twinkle protein